MSKTDLVRIDIGFNQDGEEVIQTKGFTCLNKFRKFVDSNKDKITSVDGKPMKELLTKSLDGVVRLKGLQEIWKKWAW